VYKDKRRTKRKEAETANATAAENESQVRPISTPFNMGIFETLLGLSGHGVVLVPMAAEHINNPLVRQIQPRAQNAQNIPPDVRYELLRITYEWHNARAATDSGQK
jgi:hypothetical protein